MPKEIPDISRENEQYATNALADAIQSGAIKELQLLNKEIWIGKKAETILPRKNGDKIGWKSSHPLRLRAEPGKTAEINAIAEGAEVTITGAPQNIRDKDGDHWWYPVVVGTGDLKNPSAPQTGWVSAEFIKASPPPPPPPEPAPAVGDRKKRVTPPRPEKVDSGDSRRGIPPPNTNNKTETEERGTPPPVSESSSGDQRGVLPERNSTTSPNKDTTNIKITGAVPPTPSNEVNITGANPATSPNTAPISGANAPSGSPAGAPSGAVAPTPPNTTPIVGAGPATGPNTAPISGANAPSGSPAGAPSGAVAPTIPEKITPPSTPTAPERLTPSIEPPTTFSESFEKSLTLDPDKFIGFNQELTKLVPKVAERNKIIRFIQDNPDLPIKNIKISYLGGLTSSLETGNEAIGTLEEASFQDGKLKIPTEEALSECTSITLEEGALMITTGDTLKKLTYIYSR